MITKNQELICMLLNCFHNYTVLHAVIAACIIVGDNVFVSEYHVLHRSVKGGERSECESPELRLSSGWQTPRFILSAEKKGSKFVTNQTRISQKPTSDGQKEQL